MKNRRRNRFDYNNDDSPYFVLNHESGYIINCKSPRHAVAVARSKNKLLAGRHSWKWHACMWLRGNFYMLDMDQMYQY